MAAAVPGDSCEINRVAPRAPAWRTSAIAMLSCRQLLPLQLLLLHCVSGCSPLLAAAARLNGVNITDRPVVSPASIITASTTNTSQLSRQTQEWWRWVLVRIYDSSMTIADGDDDARQAFIEKWRPDVFDWGGDQRWQVREWARLHGIAVAAAGDMEYEEAQFRNHVYVDQTWGVTGGVAINGAGNLAGFASGGLSPYMTHAAPKWHTTVTQPHIRHARAYAGEAINQDNSPIPGLIADICRGRRQP